MLNGQGTDKEYTSKVRRLRALGFATLLAIGITGCGFNADDADEAQSLIKKGCKEFTQNLLKKSSDSAYVETFSKLAILDPAYLEISKAAGIYSTTNALQGTSASNQFKEMYVESVGTLYGLCQSVK